MTANTSGHDPHLRLRVADGAIELGCANCGEVRRLSPDISARAAQYELTGWCGQHYDCRVRAPAPQALQDGPGSTRPAMREVSLKDAAKRKTEARKAFEAKLVDLFGVDREDL